MGIRFAAAKAVSSVSTWGLKNVFRRPAANFPGKIALYVDPDVIGHLSSKLRCGSIVVVGTNGKTTTTNLIADVIERSGKTVMCNRTGANLDSGIATTMLQSAEADWGVFESDELWLARILPQLKADYVVLLNLFRDQLDRCGEIDRIQDVIARTLMKSPATTVIFNADDPLCAAIALSVDNPKIAFGVGEDLRLPQNTVADAQMCQKCSGMLEYAYRQYGQLGVYRCPQCGFARPELDYAATNVAFGADDVAFRISGSSWEAEISAPVAGSYMVYNLSAVAVASHVAGCDDASLRESIASFDPKNGRLERLVCAGMPVLLNLAKNPTGFNQNLKIVMNDEGPVAVGFFVNDKEGDGRDVSWLWDVDFEELAARGGVVAYAGGLRANDVQVRLKYAGVDAEIVEDAGDMMARIAKRCPSARVYAIANYTALPAVKEQLERMAGDAAAPAADAAPAAEAAPAADAAPAPDAAPVPAADAAPAAEAAPALVIAHVFPDLLNLYGDGGNVRVLEHRARARAIPVEVRSIHHGDALDLSDVDIVFLGGGPDREQRLASDCLMGMRDAIRAFVEDDGVLLAICGGYQMLGRTWVLGDDRVEGLGILDMETRRGEGSADRLVGDIVVRSDLAPRLVVGYENHAGRTFLGKGVQPFGAIAASCGRGNNGEDGQDGARYRNVVGTYLHGPLLSKNPELADELLLRALSRRAAKAGLPEASLCAIDDTADIAANEEMRKRLGAAS